MPWGAPHAIKHATAKVNGRGPSCWFVWYPDPTTPHSPLPRTVVSSSHPARLSCSSVSPICSQYRDCRPMPCMQRLQTSCRISGGGAAAGGGGDVSGMPPVSPEEAAAGHVTGRKKLSTAGDHCLGLGVYAITSMWRRTGTPSPPAAEAARVVTWFLVLRGFSLAVAHCMVAMATAGCRGWEPPRCWLEDRLPQKSTLVFLYVR